MFFFFQAEDGIRDLVRSRGLGDVYKRQLLGDGAGCTHGLGWPGVGAALREEQGGFDADTYLSLIHI